MDENLSETLIDETDVEAGSIATCRICLQSRRDGVEDEDLISPCMCKGTQQFVHRSCLDHWRSVKEGFDFSHCTTCKAQFHLRFVELEEKSWRLFVARDVIITFLVLQTVIASLGGLVYLADHKHGYLNDLFKLLRHPILIYYCVGMILATLLMWAFLCYNIILKEHHTMGPCEAIAIMAIFMVVLPVVVIPGILIGTFDQSMKQHKDGELTKVYVVEDLNGCYSAPKELDPVHMERLKSLELL